RGRTSTDGTTTVDLNPNADYDTENNYYRIVFHLEREQPAFLIEKTAGSEPIGDALVASPADLPAAAPTLTQYDALTTTVSGKVAKAGDTMTGDLDLGGNYLLNKHTPNMWLARSNTPGFGLGPQTIPDRTWTKIIWEGDV